MRRKIQDHKQRFEIEIKDSRPGLKNQVEILTFNNHKEYLKKMSELGRMPAYTSEITKTQFFIYPHEKDQKTLF